MQAHQPPLVQTMPIPRLVPAVLVGLLESSRYGTQIWEIHLTACLCYAPVSHKRPSTSYIPRHTIYPSPQGTITHEEWRLWNCQIRGNTSFSIINTAIWPG